MVHTNIKNINIDIVHKIYECVFIVLIPNSLIFISLRLKLRFLFQLSFLFSLLSLNILYYILIFSLSVLFSFLTLKYSILYSHFFFLSYIIFSFK